MKHLILVIFSTCLSIGCFGQWGAFRLTVETKAAVDLGSDSARFGGIYNIIGTKRSDEYVHGGIQWGRSPNLPPFKYTNGLKDSTYIISYLQQKDSLFVGTIESLLPNTTYYVRACLYAGWGGRYTPVYGNVVTFNTQEFSIKNNGITTSNQVLCIDTNRKARVLVEAIEATGGDPDSALTYLWQYRPSNIVLWNDIDSSNAKDLNYLFDVPAGSRTYLIRRVVTSGTTLRSESSPVRVSFLGPNEMQKHSISITTESQKPTEITLLSSPSSTYGGYSMNWQVLDTNIADTFVVDTPSTGSQFLINNPSKNIWVQSVVQYQGNGPNRCPQFKSQEISFTDPDANGTVYPMVEVGKQYWMINNLRARWFSDRSQIGIINDPSQWASTSLPALAFDSISTWDSLSHGLLYNQYVFLDTLKQICPVGWQVPSLADWSDLMDTLGGFTKAGRDLKINQDWNQPLFIGTNPINFNALPTGLKQGSDGILIGRDSLASFWTISDSGKVQYLDIYADTNIARIINKVATEDEIRVGRSIRCMKNGDGSTIITNNLISTEDTSLCVSTKYQTQIYISGKLPSGGLNGNFTYEWEISTSGISGPWKSASGADSLQNYSTKFGPFSSDSTVFFRRKITSGIQNMTSNLVSIKFQIPVKRDTSLVNISQVAGKGDTLVLKASLLGNSKTPNLYWAKSTQSDTAGFNDIVAYGDSITLVNPKSDTWIQVEAHTKLDNGGCQYNHSRGIGFTTPDGNGNIYLYTTIGKLRWMTNNLRATRNDSVSLTEITGLSWGSSNAEAYCWYNNDSASNSLIHGALYNIHVVLDSTANVCPKGWNIPEVSEWNYLVSQAGGVLKAGPNLRSVTGWVPTTNVQLAPGKNTFNFNSKPGGYRIGNGGIFASLDKIISMWLYPQGVGNTVYGAYTADVGYPGQPAVSTGYISSTGQMGRSIRCVQSVDGSIVISNNSILTPDTFLCSSSSSSSSINLNASTPTGGLNGQFTYQWQYTDSANLIGWKAAPGTNSGANYTAARISGSTVPTVWYRRIVESGHRFNNSEPVSITYIDSTGIRGHVDLVNISQIDGGANSIVKLKNKSLPKPGIGVINWYKSTTSDSTGFIKINGYQDSMLSILNPDTNTWYFSTRIYYDTVSRVCVVDSSPAIGFTPPDGDSNYYAHTKIGEDYWAINNLRTTKDLYGNPISLISDSASWFGASGEAYCWVQNNGSNKISTGALYNYFASTMTDSLCPIGWKIPTLVDWLRLKRNAGNSSAGTALRTTYNWDPFQAVFIAGQNSFNFNAYPTGYRLGEAMSSHNSTFRYSTSATFWWVNKAGNSGNQYHIYYVTSKTNDLPESSEALNNDNKRRGLPIRCVKKR